jgi:YHS domain-containing protein
MTKALDVNASGSQTRSMEDEIEKDPVCGRQFEMKRAREKAGCLSRTFHFCITGCHRALIAVPKENVDAAARESGPNGGAEHCGRATMRNCSVLVSTLGERV